MPDTVIMCPKCKHKQHAMSPRQWLDNARTSITFSCKNIDCKFSETRDGALWQHLVTGGSDMYRGFDKNGC